MSLAFVDSLSQKVFNRQATAVIKKGLSRHDLQYTLYYSSDLSS